MRNASDRVRITVWIVTVVLGMYTAITSHCSGTRGASDVQHARTIP
jgi:hypothetical protein